MDLQSFFGQEMDGMPFSVSSDTFDLRPSLLNVLVGLRDRSALW